jgi:hypothetical protein
LGARHKEGFVKVKLVSHINADGDLLPAWFEYYSKLGITSFHLIVHGPPEENARLFEVIHSYPIHIEQTYRGQFTTHEKELRINSLLAAMRGGWVLLVDSDEFVELPYTRLSTTIRKLEILGANALFAPMIQRMTSDGSLESPEILGDPFGYFPLCSSDLYGKMGVDALTAKYPLFFCNDQTYVHGGNHYPTHRTLTVLSHLQGATHHFKWRKPVVVRLANWGNSAHSYRHESAGYLRYLESHGYRLPTQASFYYSRRELVQRGLLRRMTSRTEDDLGGAYNNKKWWENTFLAIKESATIIPEAETFILVDEEQFAFGFFTGRDYIPFLEHKGQYWGPPPDDDTAIKEVERLRKAGASFIVFGFPAFWSLDFYTEFHRYLRSNFHCVLENDRIVVFDLRSSRGVF